MYDWRQVNLKFFFSFGNFQNHWETLLSSSHQFSVLGSFYPFGWENASEKKTDFFLINFSNWELNNLSLKYKFFCFTQNSHKMCFGCFQILSIGVANLDFHNDIALSSLELPYSWTSFNYIIGGRMLMWMDSLSQKDHI